jgi:4-hydroxybenzoyl-CoA thioesterase
LKFTVNYLVRFQHCDPAGIVFYPRYYEMFHQVIEDWFANGLKKSHPELIRNKIGIPLVHANCDFLGSAHIGDIVTFSLVLKKIGRSSFTAEISGEVENIKILVAELVIAFVSLESEMKSIPIPEDLRELMSNYMV